MNRRTYRSVLILASAAFGLAGCVSTASTRTAGETIDDSTLTARVKTALIGDERTKARQIDVDTYRGDVQLNGFVDSAAAKTAAASVAQNVAGVTKVTNNLQVGEDRTTGEVVDDAIIDVENILRRLRNRKEGESLLQLILAASLEAAMGRASTLNP